MSPTASSQQDTIVAQATPPGRGGVGIIRISGANAASVAHALLGKLPRPRHAEYLPFLDQNQQPLDQGIALWFPAPHSFTGENVLELQGHGGPILLDLLIRRILQLPGIRLAEPGEFSRQAFLNGKLDLTQAEAIADLINASGEQAARCALNSLQGDFSRKIHQLTDALTALRIYTEAAIDFPDDEIDFLTDGHIIRQLDSLIDQTLATRRAARQGSLLRDGMKVVIAGRPNAGKSSLLNALAGRDAAIVTAIPGTTRDLLQEHIHIDGMPLHIIDTAGLRTGGDEVERIGIARALQAIEQADHLLFLVDASTSPADHLAIWPELLARLPARLPVTIVRNKTDLTAEPPGIDSQSGYPRIKISARHGDGIDTLRQHLKQSIGYTSVTETGFIARRRHLQALDRASEHLQQGKTQLLTAHAAELLAEELRLAQHALGEITGQITSDDLLGRIFSSFCIGK